MSEPKRSIQSPEEAAEQVARNKERENQLKQAYSRFLESEDGQNIMEDLMGRYGWRNGMEMPTYRTGMTSMDASHRDGMKEPIRHILAMAGKVIVIKSNNPNENNE